MPDWSRSPAGACSWRGLAKRLPTQIDDVVPVAKALVFAEPDRPGASLSGVLRRMTLCHSW
ncbi:protein of unknown function [Paraburkholderia dioscoreae]|uniref:Uncharacterized protein n=1 Tax=Paraburkholderia dioscoreae TaxID=2604047 RepID=A0A5Q4ZEY4_9BURK|nr:protein of unknown function [Paraburkholderia dioscoreae]